MMTFKTIGGFLLAGSLLASGTASAALIQVWTSGDVPISTWTSITDGDGDTTFALDSSTLLNQGISTVSLHEFQDNVTNQEYYRVEFANGSGLGLGNVRYSISTTDPLGLNWAEIDSSHIGSGAATKELFDSNTFISPFVTLTSTNGLTQEGLFLSRNTIYVQDSISSGTITNLINNYQVVPEPISLSLFGIGLAALRFSRRRTA